MKRLPVLCPQEYEGMDMRVTPCNRCDQGWDKDAGRCAVYVGVERFVTVAADKVPECPIADRCQHQLQATPKPCLVRERGFICESALVFAGVPDAEDHPLSFNDNMMADARPASSTSF